MICITNLKFPPTLRIFHSGFHNHGNPNMEVKAGWGNTWNYLSWGIWLYCGVTDFGIWRWYLFESVRMISKVKFDLLSFPGCNYFLKRKILQWPYYISPSHYLFGTSSKWYPKENLQKSYKLKYPSWTLQSPFIFHVYIWKYPDFETHKKNPLYKLMTFTFESQAQVLSFYWTHLEELVFVRLVWPIPPRNKMTYEAHHKDKWKASVQPLSNQIKLWGKGKRQ